MTGEWLSLEEGETVAWRGSPRLTTVLPAVGVGGAVAVVALWIAATVDGTGPLLLAALPIAVAVPLYSYLRVTNTAFVVTDRAVYVKTGVVGRRVTRSPLSKVQNSSFAQDVLGSVFGYGTVRFEIAGGGDVAFWRIDDPKAVRSLVDRTRGGELPGSPDQWRAVLAEVRDLREAFEARDGSR